MTNSKTARILKDLSAMSDADKQALLVALGGSVGKTPSVTIQDYKGKPVLYFEGNFRPFHMGMSKLKVAMANKDKIEAFIASGGKKID